MAADGSFTIDAKLNTSGVNAGAKEVAKAMNSLKTAAGRSSDAMGKSVGGFANAMRRASSATKGVSSNYTAIQKEIAKTEAAIKRLEGRQDKMLAMAEQRAQAQRDQLRKEMEEEVKSAIGYGNWELMPKWSQDQALQANLRDYEGRLKAIQSEPVENTEAWRSLQYDIDIAKEKLAQLQGQLSAAASEESKISSAGAGVQSAFNSVGQGARNAISTLGKLAGHAAVGFLKQLASGAKNAAIQLIKLAGNAVRTGLAKIGQLAAGAAKGMARLAVAAARGLGTAAKNLIGINKSIGSSGGFKLGLRNILLLGIGVKSLSALFSKLRSAIIEGLSELSNRNPQAQAAINSLKGALNGLKGSFASAFAPILTAVAPALTTLINLLATAVNYIGMFMAALSGQGYYTAAKGIGAVGSAAGSAGGAVNDLKRELAGFDDLEILSDNSSGGGGGGGGGGAGGMAFDTIPIDSGIQNFVDRMKALFAAGEYDEIGRIIAEGINGAFEKAKQLISWDNLGGRITEAVIAITEIFNHLVDNVDWDLIGQTFGEGVNTIVDTINLLYQGIDWRNLGRKLATGFNGLVYAVEWDELGRLFSEKINSVLDVIAGAVNEFDFKAAGDALGTAIKSFVYRVNWPGIGETIGNLFNGSLTFIRGAINEIDFGDAGAKLGAAIRSLIYKVDWPGLGDTIGTLINGALAYVRATINNIDFGDAGTKLGDAFNHLIYSINWPGLGNTIGNLFDGVLAYVRGAVNKVDFGDAGTKLGTAIRSLIYSVNWPGMGETVGTLFNGVLAFIRNAINNVDFADAGAKLGSAIQHLITIVNWPGIGATLSNLVNGVFAYVRLAVNNIDFADAGAKLGTALNKLFTGIKWNNIGTTLSNLFNGVLAYIRKAVNTFDFKGVGENIGSAISTFFMKIKWKDLGSTLGNLLIGALAIMKGAIKKFNWPGLGDKFKEFLLAIPWREIGEEALKLFLTGFGSLSDTVIGFLFGKDFAGEESRRRQQGYRNVGDAYEAFKEDPKKVIEDTYEGLKNMDLKSGLGTLWGALTQPYKENLPKAAEEGIFSKIGNLLFPSAKAEEANTEALDSNTTRSTKSEDKNTKALKENTEALGNTSPEPSPYTIPLVLDENGNAPDFPTPTVDAEVNFRAKDNPNAQNGGLLGYLQQVFAPGTTEETRVELLKQGWTTIAAFVGTAVRVLTSLGKDGWTTIGGFVGTAVRVLTSLGKNGWTTISSFIGTAVKVFTSLGKDGWTTIAKFIGTAVKVLTSLGKDGWTTIAKFVGTAVKVLTSLGKDGWSSISKFVGTAVTVFTSLKKSGWSNILKFITGHKDGSVGIKLSLGSIGSTLKSALGKLGIKLATGGVITPGGRVKRFASGGIINGGLARYFGNIPQYASGTSRAHGTMFIAGEAGPEIVGHIGGRTEILNKSQLAQTMYAAVENGMLSAMSRIEFRMPAMATGSVMPYEISAQIAKATLDIQSTLDANNEDLIQTIISVIGAQTAAIVGALNSNRQQGIAGPSTQQIIDEINRRTQMFSASPLTGV